MAISIKSQREIELMREAGRILTIAHEEMRKVIKPGISTFDIDKTGEEVIRSLGGIPACLNYGGFPASVCVSVNDEVVHGIPSKDRIIDEGDIVTLDTVVNYKGYHCDSARTNPVGEVSENAKRLMQVTKESFFESLKVCKEGYHIRDISETIFNYIAARGYSAVRDLTGHGIGTSMHESPEIPNFVSLKKGPKLRAGMTLAIEPMINEGRYEVIFLDDEWTVVTADGKLSSHYENTVLITTGEPEILSVADGIEL